MLLLIVIEKKVTSAKIKSCKKKLPSCFFADGKAAIGPNSITSKIKLE
jgi:hypothetical protein